MLNNQTIPLLPAELFFTMGRLAAICSLLFIVILVLVVIFFLFFQQQNSSHFDEYELRNDTDPVIIESKVLELSSFKQYASTDHNQLAQMTTSMNSCQSEIDEQKTRSTANLLSAEQP